MFQLGSEVLTAVLLAIRVFWNAKLCREDPDVSKDPSRLREQLNPYRTNVENRVSS